MEWIDLSNGSVRLIWEGKEINQVTFDQAGKKLAFLVPDSIGNAIWCYESTDTVAKLRVDNQTEGLGKEYQVADWAISYSEDGRRLFFDIKRIPSPIGKKAGLASVDIWSYMNVHLPVAPESLERPDKILDAVISEGESNLIVLKKETDDDLTVLGNGNSGYAFASETVPYTAADFGKDRLFDYFIVNTHSGIRKCIAKHIPVGGNVRISPSGKYILWFDKKLQDWMCYNVEKTQTHDLTSLVNHTSRGDSTKIGIFDLGPWLPDGKTLFMYDQHDIWKIDPDGITSPQNITNGMGRKNGIEFKFVATNAHFRQNMDNLPVGWNYKTEMVENRGIGIVWALNERNKENGFYQVAVKSKTPSDPVPLIMRPEIFYQDGLDEAPLLVKAKSADIYMIKRMSAMEYPNLELTSDFKDFLPITNLAPQKKYNWLSSELMHWKTFDGSPGTGILYKPENFDPSKKYPVIFYFYEQLSNQLNLFLRPSFASGRIDIPTFVSRGYLVFVPDIYYKIGNPGAGVYNYVVSAAEMVSKLPFVDSSKMGAEGHSYGGWEVNYLITRTKLFSAAVSASGLSDFINRAGTISEGDDGYSWVELWQLRMGKPLWEQKSSYMENSPVFNANKIFTPLLILANKGDGRVPWTQGLEYFLALRRLQKPCWLLQYDNGNHILLDVDQSDYTMRLLQFFDHYLKNQPCPVWMTKNIPSYLKGADSFLEIDGAKTTP